MPKAKRASNFDIQDRVYRRELTAQIGCKEAKAIIYPGRAKVLCTDKSCDYSFTVLELDQHIKFLTRVRETIASEQAQGFIPGLLNP